MSQEGRQQQRKQLDDTDVAFAVMGAGFTLVIAADTVPKLFGPNDVRYGMVITTMACGYVIFGLAREVAMYAVNRITQ